MRPSLVKIQYTELKLSCGNDPVVKNSIYRNGDLDPATNSYLFVDCLNILKDNMRSYFQYLLLVQSSEEAKKEKEEKKRYLIRKVIYKLIRYMCISIFSILDLFPDSQVDY
jgi:hypothetical protein